MHRLLRLLLVVLICASASSGAAQIGTANMLRNSSFEEGRANPDDWAGFGLAPRGWEFGGRDGGRCITISGDGANAGWWYAKHWTPVQPDRLYGVSLWARAGAVGEGQSAFVGLSVVDGPVILGSEWQHHELYFRTPSSLPRPEFRVGQREMQGQAYFDDTDLMPVVPVYRSMGGGFALGDGESIAGGHYVAVDDLTTAHTNDSRFLESFTAEFHGDRWVFDGAEEVVYRHEVQQIGISDREKIAPISDRAYLLIGGRVERGSSLPGERAAGDASGERVAAQRPIRIDVEVARYGGPLAVQVCQDGHTWQTTGVITGPGASTFNLASAANSATAFWVRLRSRGASHTEVTRYRYESTINDSSATDVGASHYLTVLHADPDISVTVTAVGDLVPGNRNEVRLLAQAPAKQTRLECRVTIEKNGKEVWGETAAEWAVPGSWRRVDIPYTIPDASAYMLRITGRDAGTGKLLFLLERPVSSPPR